MAAKREEIDTTPHGKEPRAAKPLPRSPTYTCPRHYLQGRERAATRPAQEVRTQHHAAVRLGPRISNKSNLVMCSTYWTLHGPLHSSCCGKRSQFRPERIVYGAGTYPLGEPILYHCTTERFLTATVRTRCCPCSRLHAPMMQDPRLVSATTLAASATIPCQQVGPISRSPSSLLSPVFDKHPFSMRPEHFRRSL